MFGPESVAASWVDVARLTLELAAVVCGVGAAFYTWLHRRDAARREELADLRERTARLEGAAEHALQPEEFHRLCEDVAGIKESVRGWGEGMRRVQNLLDELVANEFAEARAAKQAARKGGS